MGRRVLTASTLTFHQKRKHNASSFAPSNLDGEDLLNIFHAWATELDVDTTHDKQRQNWVSVAKIERYAHRVELLDLRVGSYGEPGELVNITNGEAEGEIGNDQAPTGANRALLFVPDRGSVAYFLAEGSTRGSAGGHILRLFKSYFSSYTNQITMVAETVTESEAWSAGAKLMEIEVRLKDHTTDIADGPKIEVGTLSYVAKPKRRAFFPGSLLPQLHRGEVLQRVVAIPELRDDKDVYVTMERDGRRKKFVLGTEGAPTVREVLNEANQPALSDADLVERCTDKVLDLCGRNAETWDIAWSQPDT